MLIFLEQIVNFFGLPGVLLIQKCIDGDRRIEVLQDIHRLVGKGVKLRLGKVLMVVMLEAHIIDHHENEGGQDQLGDAMPAGGTAGRTGGRSIGFHGKIKRGGRRPSRMLLVRISMKTVTDT